MESSPPLWGLSDDLITLLGRKYALHARDYLLNRSGIFEVAVVQQARETPTPSKAKIFAKLPKLVPEPQRHLIPTVAVQIDVKRLTGKVF